MRILRIETETGEGVYSRGFGYRCTRAMIEESLEDWHPCPARDARLSDWWEGAKLSRPKLLEWTRQGQKKWRCAFGSFEQLLDWFPLEGLELMSTLNKKHDVEFNPVAIVVYDVPHHKAKRGEKQVMYHEDHVTFVERIELDDFISNQSKIVVDL